MRRELIVAVEKALSEGAASVGAKRHRATAFFAAGTALIAVIASFYWWNSSYSSAPAVASRKAVGGSVPVSVAVVARQTVPLYLTGLGTVQASLTVDIRSKVDGELRQVMFTEGQHVKKGDDLAKIDPRLFQAALDQAKAKKAQDEAALIAAEKDLGRAEALILKNVETQQNVDQQRSKVDQTKALISADAAAIEFGSDPTRLHRHHGAERRPHRHPAGRSG